MKNDIIIIKNKYNKNYAFDRKLNMTNLDKYSNYYATFAGKRVDLYNYNKQLIRRYNMKSDVVNAQVTGAGKDTYVAIVCKDGRSYLYKSNGQLVRQ